MLDRSTKWFYQVINSKLGSLRPCRILRRHNDGRHIIANSRFFVVAVLFHLVSDQGGINHLMCHTELADNVARNIDDHTLGWVTESMAELVGLTCIYRDNTPFLQAKR